MNKVEKMNDDTSLFFVRETFHTGLLPVGKSDLLPINSSRRDEGVLILKQNHCDALLAILQERQSTQRSASPLGHSNAFMRNQSAAEDTHNTGSHTTSAAPPLLHFGGGVGLCLVVSTADLFHLSVETIWEEDMNVIKCKLLFLYNDKTLNTIQHKKLFFF